MLKCRNHSSTTRNYAVTYNQTLEEVPRHLGLMKLKKQIFKELEKNCEN